MPIEIEKRFLVKDDRWRLEVTRIEHFHDGLLARFGGGKVRIRIGEDSAWIAIKGPRAGARRSEFEYEIPLSDAIEIIHGLCEEIVIEKRRHTVPHAGHIWSVDEHLGALDGLVFAEVELASEDEAFSLPPWAGREITHDPQFRKEALIRRARGEAAAASMQPDMADAG